MRILLLRFLVVLLPVLASCGHPATPVATTQPLSTSSTIAEKSRIPHAPINPGEIREMSLEELGNFQFDPDKDDSVPADVQALDGHTIRLRGFMLALTQADKIIDFALLPRCPNGSDYLIGVQHTVVCRTSKDKSLAYTMDEIVVEGKLTVQVKQENGHSYSIFEMDVTSVKLAQ